MASPSEFDPYYQWLGIAPKDQPPHAYRLLGLEAYESHPEAIEAALEQRTLLLRAKASGPRGAHTQRLLNELNQAAAVLLNPDRKSEYDAELRLRIEPMTVGEAEPIYSFTGLPSVAVSGAPSAVAVSVPTQSPAPVARLIPAAPPVAPLVAPPVAPPIASPPAAQASPSVTVEDPPSAVPEPELLPVSPAPEAATAAPASESTNEPTTALASSHAASSLPLASLPGPLANFAPLLYLALGLLGFMVVVGGVFWLTRSSSGGGPLLGKRVELISARYGAGNSMKEVAEMVREAMKDPYAPIAPDNRVFGDPAFGQKKELEITVAIDGEKQVHRLGESHAILLPAPPEDGIAVPGASREFTLLAARCGMGLKWIDVTAIARERVHHPARSVCWGGLCDQDSWVGVHKQVAVWFDFEGRRYARLYAEGEIAALITTIPELPAEPLPLVMKAYEWSNGNPPTPIAPADQVICTLGALQGKFRGFAEKIELSLVDGANWQLGVRGGQFLYGKAHTIAGPFRELLELNPTPYHWDRGKERVKMIHSSEGFCVLSAVTGHFAGAGESVRVGVDPADGYWYLEGQTAQPLAAFAFAYRLKKDAKVRLQMAEYVRTLGVPPIRMIHKDHGFCYLSGIGGAFTGESDKIDTFPQADGYWYLASIGSKPNVARAYAIRVLPAN